MKTTCQHCGSDHCGGVCYTLPTNPYFFPASSEGPKCPSPCERPAHFHDESGGHWCLMHAPQDKFPLTPTERARFRQGELLTSYQAMAHFLREVYLKPSHAPLQDLGKCKDCDTLRRILFRVEELEARSEETPVPR